MIIEDKKTPEEKTKLTRELFTGLITDFTTAHTALVGAAGDRNFTTDGPENAKVHAHMKTKLTMVEEVLKELNAVCNGTIYIEKAIRTSKPISIKENVQQWKTNFGDLQSKDLGETMNANTRLDELTKLYNNLSGIFDNASSFDTFRTMHTNANKCPPGYGFYSTDKNKKIEQAFGEFLENLGCGKRSLQCLNIL